MTVSSTTTKVSYSGNGSTTVFAYGFKIFADADLRVIERAADGNETVKSLTTHYTVSGAGTDSGGNVTFGTAPASGVTVIIKRNLTLTQGTDYVANDPFPAESHEEALDRLTFIAQGIQEELDRTIKASETNTLTGAEFTISATDRANKVFSFDGSGNLAVTQELGTFKGDWAASTTYAVRDLVKDTSTNNIFIVNTAHTSSGSQPLTSNANSAKYDLIVDAASATSAQTAAASSASSASTSASTATTKASEAATSATNAASSATAAAASETAAAASETASAASETASAASETAAAASQTAAAASASSASTSAATATTKASEASTSASTATTKATEAATSATTASTQASNASTSASTATTKASEASTSATNAASSATAAASSATAAASSQTAAAASAASAASAFDNFDDRFLGSKTSDPSTDNDGDALVTGALYFNTTANEMRVFDGGNFIAATSAGNVSLILYEYTATAGQTTFSGSDDNSATLSYTADNLQVVMNGIVLDTSDFTATNGTSVVLASGAATGDLINIYAFKSFTTADMVSKTNGGTFSGNVTFSGNLTADGGSIKLDGNYPTGTGNVALGDGALDDGSLSGNFNTAIGDNALSSNSSGASNTAIGNDAGISNTSGFQNVFVGDTAGDANTTGAAGVAVGYGALGSNTTASNNTALGYQALTANETGTGNVVAGDLALDASVNGSNNVAVGSQAGSTGTSLSNCVFVGRQAGLNCTGNSNTLLGRSAGENISSGAKNTIVGQYNGNQVGVDIRTSNNNIVLSDGDGNAPVVIDTSRIRLGNAGSGVPNDSVWAGTATRSGSVFFSSGTNNDNHYLGIQSKSNSNMYLSKKSGYTDSTYISFFNNNTMNGSIRTTGSAVAYNTTSDYRVKDNVADMTGAIARVKQLAPKRFNFIADDSVTVDGFLAHEAQTVVPEAVSGTHNEVDDDGNAVLQGIDQSKLVPLLVGALQEAIAKIETLETKVAALEAG